jgi:putative ABC transport system ATP-binding protein
MRSPASRGARALLVCLALAASFGLACGGADRPATSDGTPQPAAGTASPAPADPSGDADPRPKVICLGDSLTAGLGLVESQSYPSLLQRKIDEEELGFEVVNAGVSGDTTAGGLRRLEWSLQGDARVLVVALGGNDALRGLSVAEMRENLSTIIERARDRGVVVVLAGMQAPPNYGPEYTSAFRQTFVDLARQYRTPFIPFLLDGVAGDAALNQRDGIHPNPRGSGNPGRDGLARDPADSPAAVLSMIELHGVSKTVPSGAGLLTILHPLDLTIRARQVVAITGPSGSGKSTLLGLIAGLDAPSAGHIVIDGVTITQLDEDTLARLRGTRIGFVFQFFHLLPSLTAFENVLVPMEIAGYPDAARRARMLLDEVGLTDRAHHYPSQLSGGEQQRVAIARALANDPPILLADEPTGNLDSATGHTIVELLLDINRARGTTLILVTHDPELAAVADTSIALRDGHVVNTTTRAAARAVETEGA